MFFSYLKIAFRSFTKFKGFTTINLLGLSMGLTAGLLIMIYVMDELSYDQFHTNKERLYRVNTRFFNPASGGTEDAMDANGWPIGATLRKDFPEVEAVLYTRNASGLLINHKDKHIRQNIHFASPEFLHMFSFPLIKGNAQTALNEPYAMVITEDMEKKYFPGEDALNKTLVINDTLQFVITGVMANLPANSHIQLDMIASFATFEKFGSFNYSEGWGNINMRNYVLLKADVDATAFTAKAKDIYTNGAAQMLKDWGVSAELEFEPLSKLYLTTKAGNGMGPVGSIDRIWLVAGIALFVIVLACINFVNLATARSVYRAREVGMRKVVGSTRAGITAQFLSESFVLTGISFLVAVVFAILMLPVFNELLGKNYQMQAFLTMPLLAGAASLVVMISLLSGYYPAWIMSALRPVEVIKGKMQNSKRGVQLRRSLVVFQFVISVGLVMGTLIVIDQLEYMQKRDLGFAKDEIVVVNAARAKSPNSKGHETFRNELKTMSMVDEVTFTNALPGSPGWQGQVAYPEGKSGDEAVSVQYMAIDENYVTTLGLEIIAGRDFDVQREMDHTDGLILNEAAVSLMGWSSPQEAIGKRITSPSGYPAGEVIGVVKNITRLAFSRKLKEWLWI